MMGNDLISIESVIDLLSELRIDNIVVNGKRITEHIEELPTAYNLDAVVEQLENGGQKMAEENPTKVGRTVTHRYYKAISVKKAVDIVRNGGKE